MQTVGFNKKYFFHLTLDTLTSVCILSKLFSLHPNISMHTPQTVLYTFPKVLTRRKCLIIKRFFSW